MAPGDTVVRSSAFRRRLTRVEFRLNAGLQTPKILDDGAPPNPRWCGASFVAAILRRLTASQRRMPPKTVVLDERRSAFFGGVRAEYTRTPPEIADSGPPDGQNLRRFLLARGQTNFAKNMSNDKTINQARQSHVGPSHDLVLVHDTCFCQ